MANTHGQIQPRKLFVAHLMSRCASIGFMLIVLAVSGCAAMRPLKGIPASQLPDDYRLPYRSVQSMIDLSLLRQTPPREHIVDANDILGIYIDSILGGQQNTLAPPVTVQQNPNRRSSLGYPIRVRNDGTISLPKVKPITVRGMTISQVEQAIRTAYTTGKDAPLVAGTERIFVDLHQARLHRVLVMRQESGNRSSLTGIIGQANTTLTTDKRGMGKTVNLPAYQNDVLHALAETGGLPGLDAENVIYVIRRNHRVNRQPRGASPLNSTVPPPAPAINRVGNLKPAVLNRPKPKSVKGSPVWNLSDETVSNSRRYKTIIRGQSPASSLGGPTPLSEMFPSPETTRASMPNTQPLNAGSSNSPLPARTFQNPLPRTTNQPTNTVPVSHSPLQNLWPGQIQHNSIPPNYMPVNNISLTGPNVVRIPLRLIPGEVPSISESDIILYDGDIVLIESREADVFFTGGLLGGGKFVLPRDQDLDVLQAMAVIQSQRAANSTTRAIGGISAINQDVTVGASELIVLRKLADGSQASIRVDLYKAVRDPSERILVQPGDHLMLQYTRFEAIGAFFERHIFEGLVLGGSSGLFFSN